MELLFLSEAQYSQKIKDQQAIIDELNKQLKVSNEEIAKINKNIETLKKKKEVINVPKNDEELTVAIQEECYK